MSVSAKLVGVQALKGIEAANADQREANTPFFCPFPLI